MAPPPSSRRRGGGGGADGDVHDAPPTGSSRYTGPAAVSRRDRLGAETEARLCARRSAAARDVTKGGAAGRAEGGTKAESPLVTPVTLGEALTGQQSRPIAVRPAEAARLGWRLRRLQLQVGELWGLREEWDGSAWCWGARGGGDPRGFGRPSDRPCAGARRAVGGGERASRGPRSCAPRRPRPALPAGPGTRCCSRAAAQVLGALGAAEPT